jgi:hypothetical protein
VRYLNVGDCDGEQCLSLQVAETYDLKGDYQFSPSSLSETTSINVVMSAPVGAYSETSNVQLRDGPDSYSTTCSKNAGYSYSNASVAIDGMSWPPDSSGAGNEDCNRINRDL